MTPLPKAIPGNGRISQFSRDVVRCLQERTPLPSDAVTVQRQTNGFRVEPKPVSSPATPAASKVEQFILVEVRDDVLMCYTLDGTTVGTELATFDASIGLNAGFSLPVWDGATLEYRHNVKVRSKTVSL